MRALRDTSDAIRRLRGMVQAGSEPTLAEDEILDLLEDHRIAREWSPGMAVRPGELVAPTIPTGWLYATASERDQDRYPGGVTGETEPQWPLDPRWPSWEPKSVDDGTVRFGIARAEWLGLWDLKAAAHAGWLMKASKAAGEYSVSSENASMHPEQVHEHCLAMAARFAPVRIS